MHVARKWTPGRNGRAVLATVVCVALVRMNLAAGAAGPPAIHLKAAPRGCPNPEQLLAAFAEALPERPVTVEPGAKSALTVRVEEDDDEHYRATIKDGERRFDDPTRRCRERAYRVAVWAALVLEPPVGDGEGEASAGLPGDPGRAPDGPAVTAAARKAAGDPPAGGPDGAPIGTDPGHPPALAPPPVRPLVGLDLDAFGFPSFSPDAPGLPWSGGGGLRAALTTRYPVGVALGAGAVAPMTLELDRGSASSWRVPLDLDLRLTYGRGRVEGVLDAGFVLTVLGVRGQGYVDSRSALLVDSGVRGALGLRVFALTWFAVLVAVEALWSPRSHPLMVADVEVGRTPHLWLSAMAGFSFRVR